MWGAVRVPDRPPRYGVLVALAVGGSVLLGGCAAANSSPAPSVAAPASGAAPSVAATNAPSTAGGSGDGASPAAPDAPGTTSWSLGPEAPLALTEVAAAVHGGLVWIAGGLAADGRATDRVFVLDPETGDWSDGPAVPETIHHAALVSDGQALWLLGGYVGDGFDRPTDAVRTLTPGPADAAWRTAAPLPEPRSAGAAAWDGTRIVYAGGVGPGVVSELVFVGGAAGFEPVARLSEAREHLAAASDGAGRTWFLGGRRGGLEGNLGRVDLVEGETLTTVGDVPTPRGGVAAFHWPSLGPCLVGGESPDGTNPQVECIAADGTSTVLPSLAFPRHGLGAVVVDGIAYVLLGGPVPGLTASGTLELLSLP